MTFKKGCVGWSRGIIKNDLTGRKFGLLTAIKFHSWEQKPYSITRRSMWLFRCDCGNEIVRAGSIIHYGNMKSCGCSHANFIGKGEAAFLQVIRTYKNHARRRGISWKIAKEKFRELTQKNCFYCDSLPSNVSKKGPISGNFVYNGVDRIDSSKGYSVKNCVPCCKYCNWMKSDMNQQEFLSHINKIGRVHGK